MEEDGNARDVANTNSAYFSGTRKGDVIGDERLRHEWSTYRWRYLLVCYRSEAAT